MRRRVGLRLILLALLWVGCSWAGTINGVVLEAASGRPLGRAMVQLRPVAKAGAQSTPLSVRAGSSGSFTFFRVPDGLYLIVATRQFYFPTGYGQRRPSGQGTPVEVSQESNLFAELRMRRMGVLTGRVLDENDIGVAGVTVVAYRARLPVRLAGRGVSDDRGVYRIWGLEQGKHWVRTTQHTLEDGSSELPTFGLEAVEIRQARVHEVRIDEETSYADLHPMPGRLIHLGGLAQCPAKDARGATNGANIMLSSELERKTMTVNCGTLFRFNDLAPGYFELFVTDNMGNAGFHEVHADYDSDAMGVSATPMPRVDFEVRSNGARANNLAVTLTGHRQDLADPEADKTIDRYGPLAPGNWIMHATVAGADQYVESITGEQWNRRQTAAADGFEVMINNGYAHVVVNVASPAAAIEGNVVGADSKPVKGAPVFLYAETEEARRSIGGAKQQISDADGHYSFKGLPPGDYRLLATFDTSEVDAELLEAAHAVDLRLSQGQKSAMNLTLWIAP